MDHRKRFRRHPPARARAWLPTVALLLVAAMAGPAGAADYSAWRYSRPIKMDTTRSGAGVRGTVKNFPVAVTLTSQNFDFAQAKADGSDLRFTRTPTGEPLPYAIESWDKGGGTAVVWVKMDVIRGGNKSQSFLMHWGNPEAPNVAHGAAVFTKDEGFVGVYHLNEEGGTQVGGYKDVTSNEAHATGVNLKPGSRVDGRVGKGVALDYDQVQWIKIDDQKKKRLFNLTTRGTFSIWAKARAYRNKGNEATGALPGYETMFAKGDNSWRLQKFGIRDWHKPPSDLIEMCVEQPPNADLCVVGKTDMVTDRWFHVVAVHDFPRAKLYVNGVLEKTETFDVNWISGEHDVGIGNQTQFPEKGRQWDGVLDEARALRVAKDDHWIKLDYESQKEGSTFLIFGPIKQRSQS